MRRQIGMIFQQFNLVKRHSVLDQRARPGRSAAATWCARCSCRSPPDEVAFARACLRARRARATAPASAPTACPAASSSASPSRGRSCSGPRIILADEPVASLDPALRHSVMRHIEALNRDEGMTVVCSLHDIDLVQRYATRIVALKAGRLVWEGLPEDLDPDTFREIYGEDAEPASNAASRRSHEHPRCRRSSGVHKAVLRLQIGAAWTPCSSPSSCSWCELMVVAFSGRRGSTGLLLSAEEILERPALLGMPHVVAFVARH